MMLNASQPEPDQAVDTLHDAAFYGDRECVASILDDDPRAINRQNFDGFTPLMLAAMRGHVEVVSFLIEQGANGHIIDFSSPPRNALFFATKPEIKKLLLPAIGHHGGHAFYPIHTAVKRGDLHQLKDLLNQSPSHLNLTDTWGYTPLMWAVAGGYIDIVEYLLQVNADPCLSNIPFEVGGHLIGPLELAYANPHIQKRLLESHACTRTWLHSAASQHLLDEIRASVELKEFEVDVRDSFGRPPIYYALHAGDMEAFQLFIQLGANLHKQYSEWTCRNLYEAAHNFKDHNRVYKDMYDFLKKQFSLSKSEKKNLVDSMGLLVKNAIKRAGQLGKKLLITLGEVHSSRPIDQLKKGLYKMAHKYKVRMGYMESPSIGYQPFGLQKKLQETLSMDFKAVDTARNGLGRAQEFAIPLPERDEAMAKNIVEHNTSGVLVVGMDHLKGLHERLQNTQYHHLLFNFSHLDPEPLGEVGEETRFALTHPEVIQVHQDGLRYNRKLVFHTKK